MSHELRTPLNAILGFTQLLARDPHTPEEKEHLGVIQRSGEHLLTLINQVLDLSKIEAGRVTVNSVDFDLYALLSELEDLFRLLAQKKGLQVRIEHPADIPRYLRTDQLKLRQILINLLNNAIKFTQTGGVTLRVNTRSVGVLENRSIEKEPQQTPPPALQRSSAPALHFKISDTGPGIAPEELDGVFEAFSQTDSGKQTVEGTGLGLSISRKFVRLLGGDMSVESEIGQGTTFSFHIPVEQAQKLPVNSQADRRVVALSPGQPRYRMLIADDQPDNRTLLIKLLSGIDASHDSFEFREASNGREAVEIWRSWKPHLIWMDLRMPTMDGYEATAIITNEDERSNADKSVIIALSASSFDEERYAALSKGCENFLRKPFQEHELFELLHQHLGIRFEYKEIQKALYHGNGEDEELFLQEAFAALPAEVKDALAQAVEDLDVAATLAEIERIRPQNARLARTLKRFVQNYRFDVLQRISSSPPET
jgi:CheY-like chemotaxis protein